MRGRCTTTPTFLELAIDTAHSLWQKLLLAAASKIDLAQANHTPSERSLTSSIHSFSIELRSWNFDGAPDRIGSCVDMPNVRWPTSFSILNCRQNQEISWKQLRQSWLGLSRARALRRCNDGATTECSRVCINRFTGDSRLYIGTRLTSTLCDHRAPAGAWQNLARRTTCLFHSVEDVEKTRLNLFVPSTPRCGRECQDNHISGGLNV